MAIKRPDEYQHNNPALAIIDTDHVRGGARTVADWSALIGLSATDYDKLKENVSRVRVLNPSVGHPLNGTVGQGSVPTTPAWYILTHKGTPPPTEQNTIWLGPTWEIDGTPDTGPDPTPSLQEVTDAGSVTDQVITLAGLRLSDDNGTNLEIARNGSNLERLVVPDKVGDPSQETIATKEWVYSQNYGNPDLSPYALKTGVGSTGIWPISVTGNAATATNAINANTASLLADPATGFAKNVAEIREEFENLIGQLRDGVVTEGDTLQKLYNLIQLRAAQHSVANMTARNALNVRIGAWVNVEDDGDGHWAIYRATSNGTNATYVKVSDPDLLNAVMTAPQIQASYESNTDTNRFTDAYRAMLDNLSSALAAKSDTGHIHTIAQVSGLQASLDGKATLGANANFADASSNQIDRVGSYSFIRTGIVEWRLGGVTATPNNLFLKMNSTVLFEASTTTAVVDFKFSPTLNGQAFWTAQTLSKSEFYPMTGNPSGFITSAALTNYVYGQNSTGATAVTGSTLSETFTNLYAVNRSGFYTVYLSGEAAMGGGFIHIEDANSATNGNAFRLRIGNASNGSPQGVYYQLRVNGTWLHSSNTPGTQLAEYSQITSLYTYVDRYDNGYSSLFTTISGGVTAIDFYNNAAKVRCGYCSVGTSQATLTVYNAADRGELVITKTTSDPLVLTLANNQTLTNVLLGYGWTDAPNNKITLSGATNSIFRLTYFKVAGSLIFTVQAQSVIPIDVEYKSVTLASSAFAHNAAGATVLNQVAAAAVTADFTWNITSPAATGNLVFEKSVSGNLTVTLAVPAGFTSKLIDNSWSDAVNKKVVISSSGATSSFFRLSYEKVGMLIMFTILENYA